MAAARDFQLGIMFRRENPPETLVAFAQQVEAWGFDELWIVEDAFYAGGLTSSSVALTATEKIAVGLGIMPAVVRNPVFGAMEVAALARMFPGRFVAGYGHGVARWMEQVGAMPASQMTALEEVVITTRALLQGEEVTYNGGQVSLSNTELVFPPEYVPLVLLGVRGPKSLRLSGRVADGTILAEYATPDYIRWAQARIQEGRTANDVNRKHRLVVYVFCMVDDDEDVAYERCRAVVGETLLSGRLDKQLARAGFFGALQKLRERGGTVADIPRAWLDAVAVVGTPGECASDIHRFADAGADSIVLVPPPGQPLELVGALASAPRTLPE